MKRVELMGMMAGVVILTMSLLSCGQHSVTGPTGPTRYKTSSGSGTTMDAYYDGKLFTINFKEEPSTAENSQINHNGSINTIYMSDQMLPGGMMFVAVLDAIQGDGFNPLWREVDVVFPSGTTPRQFTSDNDILTAQAAGSITLDTTNEVYRCSVIGPKKK